MRRATHTAMPGARKETLRVPARLLCASLALVCASLVTVTLAGCASRNEQYADSLNPCCGQDLIEKGIEPPQDRCADMVVDQVTAMRLMKDLTGGAVAHWQVRLIPGGPACIWRMWPGDTSFKPENVQPDWVGDEPARADTTEPTSGEQGAVRAGDEPEGGSQ